MPHRTTPLGPHDEILEHLRQGTRQQYESDWVVIAAGLSHAFLHDLGEVPWSVSVIKSLQATGSQATEASGDITIAYTDVDGGSGTGEQYVLVTNDLALNYYFKVRAM